MDSAKSHSIPQELGLSTSKSQPSFIRDMDFGGIIFSMELMSEKKTHAKALQNYEYTTF